MRSAAALSLAACIIAVGCGSSSSAKEEEPDGPTLEALWRAPGEDVAITPGSADFGPGPVRLTFLIVDGRGGVVTRPTARIWIARGLEERPFSRTTARSEEIGVEGSDPADAKAIFVTTLQLGKPGTYWVLAEPVGGRKIQAVGTVVVKERTAAPDVGDRVPASETPTLASTGDDLAALTTAKAPDLELYRKSIADSVRDGSRFVVVFATPKYCTSRTCGPVVDVVSTVRRKHETSGLRFVHVEIYEDNDPAKGTNRWVDEWKLPTEPFTFVVDRTGIVRAKLEGAFSTAELEAAVKRVASG